MSVFAGVQEPQKLTAQLNSKLTELRAAKAFDPAAWLEVKANLLNEYLRRFGLKSVIVSVSGGVDSAVSYKIAKYAQSLAGSPIERVVGVAQPIHSTPSIQARAYEVAPDIITVDRTAEFDSTIAKTEAVLGGDVLSGYTRGLMRSNMRTPINYMLATHYRGIVLGTGNKDEDGYLYYFCKAGDGVVDVQLIWDLHKSEVFTLAKHLQVPESILVAPPSADLGADQTDEGELGVTYDFVEFYTTWLSWDAEKKQQFFDGLDEESKVMWTRDGALIEDVHRRNSHKVGGPVNL